MSTLLTKRKAAIPNYATAPWSILIIAEFTSSKYKLHYRMCKRVTLFHHFNLHCQSTQYYAIISCVVKQNKHEDTFLLCFSGVCKSSQITYAIILLHYVLIVPWFSMDGYEIVSKYTLAQNCWLKKNAHIYTAPSVF